MRAASLLWLFVALLLAPSDATACSCLGPAPPCQAVWDSPIVFSGEVIDVTPVPNQHGSQFMPERRVRFRVQEMWRGVRTPEITVMTGSSGGDCGYDFKPGGRYLVYTYAHAGVAWTGICSRTQRLETATEDVQYLATLEKGTPAGRIFGTATFSRGSGTERSKAAAGYEVTLRLDDREWRTKTDASGRYEFLSVQPGTYAISIELQPGERVYADRSVHLRDVRGCGHQDFSIEASGAISVRLHNVRGQPVPGITLEIIDADTLTQPLPSYRHAVSAAEGLVSFSQLPPGRYVVVANFRLPPSTRQPFWRVFHPGTGDQSAATTIALQQGQRVDLEPLVLPEPRPERVLRGTVVWPDGTPGQNVWVAALPVNTVHYAADVRTSSNGTFSIRLFEGVPHTITAHYWGAPGSGDEWVSRDVRVTLSQESETITLVLEPFKRK